MPLLAFARRRPTPASRLTRKAQTKGPIPVRYKPRSLSLPGFDSLSHPDSPTSFTTTDSACNDVVSLALPRPHWGATTIRQDLRDLRGMLRSQTCSMLNI